MAFIMLMGSWAAESLVFRATSTPMLEIVGDDNDDNDDDENDDDDDDNTTVFEDDFDPVRPGGGENER